MHHKSWQHIEIWLRGYRTRSSHPDIFRAQLSDNCLRMSLLRASKHVVHRTICLRNSYVEISRFCRTRHHEITANRVGSCSTSSVRGFQSLHTQDSLVPDEKLKKTLDDFKATSMFAPQSQAPTLIQVQFDHPHGRSLTARGITTV